MHQWIGPCTLIHKIFLEKILLDVLFYAFCSLLLRTQGKTVDLKSGKNNRLLHVWLETKCCGCFKTQQIFWKCKNCPFCQVYIFKFSTLIKFPCYVFSHCDKLQCALSIVSKYGFRILLFNFKDVHQLSIHFIKINVKIKYKNNRMCCCHCYKKDVYHEV